VPLFLSYESRSTKAERVGEIAARAVVQEKLREVRAELRAVGSLNNVELIAAPATLSLAL
jgi:hypothetical protein